MKIIVNNAAICNLLWYARTNNNIRICITSGAAEKKIAKKDFNFFSNLPKSRVGGFEKLFIKKFWPYMAITLYR